MKHLSTDLQIKILTNEILRTEEHIEKCKKSPIQFFKTQVDQLREQAHRLRQELTNLQNQEECQNLVRLL
jgi:hypothetical protein